MISKTLEKELSGYRIGEKVKQLRLERELKLVDLGSHTGLSPAMLSKIETGKLVPTLPTLMRIALVFSVGLDFFFSDESKRHAFAITRKGDRIRMPASLHKKVVPYDFESLDYAALEPKLNGFLAYFKEVATTVGHTHAGVEFIYVLSGRLELTWLGESHELEAGDSVYFDSTIEHAYRRIGKAECAGVVVTLPG